MPNRVRRYLTGIITLGSLALIAALAQWRCADPLRFAAYLLLALLAGTLKVRLPGMTGTYSLTFLFVLIGIVDLTVAETLVIASLSMVVQSIWRTQGRPRLIQVIFNAAAVVISAAVSFLAARSLGFGNSLLLHLIELALAASVYFAVNTLLVSGILALESERPLHKIWSQWFRWSFPYYRVGVAIAAMVIVSNRYAGWTYSLLLFPIMYLEYICHRLTVRSS